MIINKKSIINVNNYLDFMNDNEQFYIGIKYSESYDDILRKIGFSIPLVPGESILPSEHFGPKNKKNVKGYIKIHKNMPKETFYVIREWCHMQWTGYGKSKESCELIEIPYKRYPRTEIPPLSMELQVMKDTKNRYYICSPLMGYLMKENEDNIKNALNVMLEIFHECEIFKKDLDSFIETNIKKLNWEILPKGEIPWNKLKDQLISIIKIAAVTKRPFIVDRFETIESYNPDFVAIGINGFKGYIVFGFREKNIYILESCFKDNATYILKDQWEIISNYTKAQILNNNLQYDRIIHKLGHWYNRIDEILV